MERIAQLLDPQNEAFSYRQALVRLWVMASSQEVLNAWEQLADEKSIAPHVQSIFDQLQDGETIGTDTARTHPLALIRALDDHIASQRQPSSQSNRRNPSYPYKEGEKDYWLVPVPLEARRKAAMNRQPGRLARWFHHHAVLPCRTAHGTEVRLSLARSSLDGSLTELAGQIGGTLKVWVAHFDDGADVVWDRSASPIGHWRSQHVHPHAERWNSVVQTLNAAASDHAHVVVFPEFTLDVAHREELARHLRQNPSSIQLVVAGAFHAMPTLPAEKTFYNTAPVLDANGDKLFEHRKLRLFGRDNMGTEFAQVGTHLHVLLTPIGCMTVLICKDFLDEDALVSTLLDEVPVDWVWVPSYGDERTLKAHKTRAKKLATVSTGTSCAVAQTQNTAMKQEGETQCLLPGFGHAAGAKDPSDLPPHGGLLEFGLELQILKRVK